MRPLFIAAFAVLSTACANSAGAADKYIIDPAHTQIQFSVNRFGFNNVMAGFRDISGEIVLDQETPENSRVDVTIKAGSLDSGHDVRNEHLASEFWFNFAEHAEITFHSTNVEQTGEANAIVTGDLTLLGETNPVSLTVTLNKQGADPASKKTAVGFSATANINRLDWGMKTAENLVGSDVMIWIEALAHETE